MVQTEKKIEKNKKQDNGTIVVWAHLPPELAAYVDTVAAKFLLSRSGAIREIVRRYREHEQEMLTK